MAAWGSLKNIFENPLPDSLSSWSQLLPKAETETSFEMFGELCHRVKPEPSPNSPPPPPPPPPPSMPLRSDRTSQFNGSSWNDTMSEPDENAFEIFGELCYKSKPEPKSNSLLPISGGDSQNQDLKIQSWDEPKSDDGFSPKNSESLHLCTEGLGFESSGDADDAVNVGGKTAGDRGERGMYMRSYSDVRLRNNRGLFPPPITSIGRCGKPRVYFKSYRKDGRFVLREIRIPTQQLLHSTREDGRLKMRVISPDEDIAGGGGGEEEGEEEGKEEEEDEEKKMAKGSTTP